MIKISNPTFDNKIQQLIAKTLKTGKLSEGYFTSKFENELARINNTKYAVAFSSGTAALHTMLTSLQLEPSSEVITTPFTFIATGNAIIMANLKPVFVDIDEKTFNINPELIAKNITKKTKAILAVDLYGQPNQYDLIKNLAKKYNLPILSDSCQAIGAKYKNMPISSYTKATAFSFYATKNITTGEGGAIVTNDKKIAMLSKSFKNHGRGNNGDDFKFLGYNFRTTEIASIIGLSQLKNLKRLTEIRQNNAHILTKLLGNKEGIITPYLQSNSSHCFHQYTIRVTERFPIKRDQLLAHLIKSDIEAKIYYPYILPNYKHLSGNKNTVKETKVAKKIAQEVLSLPIHPSLSKIDLNKIASIILKIK